MRDYPKLWGAPDRVKLTDRARLSEVARRSACRSMRSRESDDRSERYLNDAESARRRDRRRLVGGGQSFAGAEGKPGLRGRRSQSPRRAGAGRAQANIRGAARLRGLSRHARSGSDGRRGDLIASRPAPRAGRSQRSPRAESGRPDRWPPSEPAADRASSGRRRRARMLGRTVHLDLRPNAQAPIHRLPVVDMLDGLYWRADFTLVPGRIIRDYLAPKT